jgi:hypothetical protein
VQTNAKKKNGKKNRVNGVGKYRKKKGGGGNRGNGVSKYCKKKKRVKKTVAMESANIASSTGLWHKF